MLTIDHGIIKKLYQVKYSEELAPNQTGDQYRQYETIIGAITIILQRDAASSNRAA